MKNYVLTPGPVPVPEFVMLEMAKPIIHHRTEEFEEIFYKATQGLKKVFMTEEEVLILASSGTGAMDAAICNTLSKGDTALVVNGGKFGDDENCQQAYEQTREAVLILLSGLTELNKI